MPFLMGKYIVKTHHFILNLYFFNKVLFTYFEKIVSVYFYQKHLSCISPIILLIVNILVSQNL